MTCLVASLCISVPRAGANMRAKLPPLVPGAWCLSRAFAARMGAGLAAAAY